MANAYAFDLKCMLAVQVKLSSAAVPDEKQTDTIVIGPPFYLELHLGGGLRRLSSSAHLYPCNFLTSEGHMLLPPLLPLMLPPALRGWNSAWHCTIQCTGSMGCDMRSCMPLSCCHDVHYLIARVRA